MQEVQLDGSSATLIPITLALVVLRLVFSVRRVVAPAPRPLPRRQNAIYGVVLGFAMFAGGGWTLTGSAAGLARYDGAPSCRAGFALAAPASGACRLVAATIVDASERHFRSRTSYDLTFRESDGSWSTASITKNRRGDVWQGAKDDSDRAATLQLFDGGPALVRTSSGIAETDNFPAHSLMLSAAFAIAGLALLAFDLYVLCSGVVTPSQPIGA